MKNYASVYARAGRDHFYVTYWDPKLQKRVTRATPFLLADPQGRRKARQLASELGKEAKIDRAQSGPDRWERWAIQYLDARYPGEERRLTRTRMGAAYAQWSTFLALEGIRVPRALDYQAVLRLRRGLGVRALQSLRRACRAC